MFPFQDNALDRADAAEEKVRQITEKLERVEEELRDTQKKMMQTENDLDKAQEDLSAATSQLEEKDKKVQEVIALASLWRYRQGCNQCAGYALRSRRHSQLVRDNSGMCHMRSWKKRIEKEATSRHV
ncbi:hypothetical protein ANCCAN_06318 [Ancylostoma caninum]|uniref:Uncharacterized protein n=1 Tax=Ancylostoma caninum TaxID=29170 RepID=A0A368GTF5_ANCCA|nr:hypothetical protein ANCCAN_06318 [Ancylostoma caninum]